MIIRRRKGGFWFATAHEVFEEDPGADIDLREALDALTMRESRIIRMRYGIDGWGPCTLKFTGAHMDISRERVRQIQSGALRKLWRRLK